MYGPGSLVAGKYRVERTLGRGGMGVVVAATHVELRMQVALKFLSDRYAVRADIVARFLREARSAAQLHSPHVCRVTDVGRLPDGVPFIVMELLLGSDLSKLLRTDGPMPAWQATTYIRQACDAVAEAHGAGIVHRDLKPGNLFLAQQRDGSTIIKVLDFGVAKVETEQDHGITSNQAVIGSPSYMAPEQLRSARAADARSDIWSLGCILHQLVSGQPPFRGETIADLAIRAATEPLPELANVPPEYAAVVARCLEKRPDARFQSVAELSAALAPLAVRPSPSREYTVPIAAVDPSMVTPSAESSGSSGSSASPMSESLGATPQLLANAAVSMSVTPVSGPEPARSLLPTTRMPAPMPPMITPVMPIQPEVVIGHGGDGGHGTTTVTADDYSASAAAPSETTLRGAASIMTARLRPGAGRRSIVIGVVAAVAIGAGGGIWMHGSGSSHKSAPATTIARPTPAPAVTDPSPSMAVTQPPAPTPAPAPSKPVELAPAPVAVQPPPPPPVAVPSAPPVAIAPVHHHVASKPKTTTSPVTTSTPTMKTKEQVGESRE